MRIYVASSWRNDHQQEVVEVLRAYGHEVYDFRHSKPDDRGFSWGDIAAEWQGWTTEEYREALTHPIAEDGFKSDKAALDWAEAGVLVLPSGRSAHLEAGYLTGQGKPCAVLACERMEPELMVKLCSGGVLVSLDELLAWVSGL